MKRKAAACARAGTSATSAKAIKSAPPTPPPRTSATESPSTSTASQPAAASLAASSSVSSSTTPKSKKELDAFGRNLRRAPESIKQNYYDTLQDYGKHSAEVEEVWTAIHDVKKSDYSQVESTLSVIVEKKRSTALCFVAQHGTAC